MTYSADFPPPRFNMAAYALGRAATAHPDKPALIVCDTPDGPPCEIWTFRELDAACRTMARGLVAQGLTPGDRIVIRLPNTSQFAIVFFGAIAAGLVPVPTSDQLTDPETAYVLRDSGARALCSAYQHGPSTVPSQVQVLSPDDLARILADLAPGAYHDTAADAPAYLIYTSGTTSKPKGVLHAHRAAWGRRPMYQGWYGLRPDDRMLHAGAFNWTYTLGTGLTDPWANGATAIIFTGAKEPDVWPRLIRAQGATLFAAVPGLYRQILKYAPPGPDGLGDLRHGLIAGEKPPPGLSAAWHADNGRQLYEALGMSEISTYISSSPTTPPKQGFVGRPQPGRSVAILDPSADPDEPDAWQPLPAGSEGLLAVHETDPGLMLGYWDGTQAVRDSAFRGPWFCGGDLALQDADGYIAHRGRANDIMKALGYRVSPMEVEAVIAACPGVAEVACAEVQVRADVSVIGAFIVPLNPDAPPGTADILAACETQLARYKIPREIRIVEALPRTANGKVKRAALTL